MPGYIKPKSGFFYAKYRYMYTIIQPTHIHAKKIYKVQTKTFFDLVLSSNNIFFFKNA